MRLIIVFGIFMFAKVFGAFTGYSFDTIDTIILLIVAIQAVVFDLLDK